MLNYLARRLLWAVLVLLAVVIITYFIAYVMPADPARGIAGPRASAEDLARIRAALGLDQPFLVQLANYFGRLLQGDLGESFRQSRDVLPLILDRFPATLQLAIAGILLELVIGVPLGVLAAARRGSNLDRFATVSSAILVAAPAFLVGYILLYLLAFLPKLRWDIAVFPIGGYEPLSLQHLLLPALTLGFTGAAYYTRLTRAMMIDELHRDYARTARAKGASASRVTWRHTFRNSIPPILSQVGLDLGIFMGGVVVVENVFNWPGLGSLAVEAINTTDIPLIMGIVLFTTLFIVIANIAVDIGYTMVDPRVRLGDTRS
jgi:peptide/nickel transport system permease protein